MIACHTVDEWKQQIQLSVESKKLVYCSFEFPLFYMYIGLRLIFPFFVVRNISVGFLAIYIWRMLWIRICPNLQLNRLMIPISRTCEVDDLMIPVIGAQRGRYKKIDATLACFIGGNDQLRQHAMFFLLLLFVSLGLFWTDASHEKKTQPFLSWFLVHHLSRDREWFLTKKNICYLNSLPIISTLWSRDS